MTDRAALESKLADLNPGDPVWASWQENDGSWRTAAGPVELDDGALYVREGGQTPRLLAWGVGANPGTDVAGPYASTLLRALYRIDEGTPTEPVTTSATTKDGGVTVQVEYVGTNGEGANYDVRARGNPGPDWFDVGELEVGTGRDDAAALVEAVTFVASYVLSGAGDTRGLGHAAGMQLHWLAVDLAEGLEATS